MTWFTGTSTGNKYTVGQSYQMGGAIYKAQADGSFASVKADGSPLVLRGSSQDPRTIWGGSSTLGGGNGGDGAGSASVVAGPQGARTTGPGSGITVTGGGEAGVGVGGYVQLEPKMKKTHTQLVIGGKPVTHDPGWSDAEEAESRWGDGDSPLDPVWYYKWGVWGADTLKGIREMPIPDLQYAPTPNAKDAQERETERILLEMIPKY